MNDAAERLRTFLNGRFVPGHPENHADWLDKALADERRATVERIRVRMQKYQSIYGNVRIGEVFAILDAEAER